MSKQITVSIIVVALNSEKTLPKLFECINKQIYPHKLIDIILVDSRSKDSTKSIMQKFKHNNIGKFNRIVLVDNPNITLPYGCNEALNKVKTDTVVRLDAHAEIPETFIQNNIIHIEKGENICCGKVISKPSNSNTLSVLLNEAENSMFGGGIADFRRIEKEKYVDTGAFAVYNFDIFKQIGLYNTNLARTEDNEIHYRMRQAGYRFLYDPKIITIRKTRPTFWGLIKQKYLNGYWVCKTIKIQPRCFSWYHFVPLLFILTIIVTTILAVAVTKIPLVIIAISYLIASVTMTICSINSRKKSENNNIIPYVFMPILFFLLHISYGLGSVVGIIIMPFWRIKK